MKKKAIRKPRAAYPKLTGKALDKAISEAQRDPLFMKEIRKFIKITTS